MTVLCLVEHDASGVADASLRALTFARDLAAGAGVGAVLFGPGDEVPRDALASYGVTGAYPERWSGSTTCAPVTP